MKLSNTPKEQQQEQTRLFDLTQETKNKIIAIGGVAICINCGNPHGPECTC